MRKVDVNRLVAVCRYHPGGRVPPRLDCWGLYRWLVGSETGIWLPEHPGLAGSHEIVRAAKHHESRPEWNPVPLGDERPLDLVLLQALGKDGRHHRGHVGCVLEPGWMVDSEAVSGISQRAYRDTDRWSAHPVVARRVCGIYRPKELA